MSSALIIYGSTTGNTEHTAEIIGEFLENQDYTTTLLNVSDVDVDIFEKKVDLYLLGCSTWGEEEIELQEDFEIFYENLSNKISLSGKKFAVFGCGDSSYTYFCGAVDVIEDRIVKLGATVVYDSLKIDGDPETEEIQEWSEEVINAL